MQRLHFHALVAELLATLEADGQSFGTGAHLRIGELLQNIPENTAPEQLKTLLAPVLCTTKEEQERFYQIFERSWKQVEAVGILEVETGEHPIFAQVKTRITPWALLTTALVLIGLWGIGNWAGTDSQKEIPIAFHNFSATVGDPEQSFQIDSLVEQSQTPGRQKFKVDPLSKFSAKKEGGYAGIRLDTQANRIFYSGLKEGSDTVLLRAYPHGWHHANMWRHQIVFSVYPPPDTSKKEDAPPDTALYVQRPIPHPRDLSKLEAPQPSDFQQFLSDWEWPLKVAAMLLAGLLVWFAARLWERNRRKLIAEHRPNQKPPYTWSIQLKNPPRVDLGERFQRLLSQLRRREADENWRLDVPRTLRATIAKGGVPQFHYAQQTRPSEYLLLIDRHSPRNHQAQLFDLMFRGFRNQEVLLERFWYDGDPRLCWNEAFPAGLDPRALHYHYPQSRVLLFGDAEQLMSQQTGRLSKWATQTFSAWQDRAVLSPRPLNAWGRREHALQELFHVLPVSLSALEVAIERFETDVEKDAELDPRRFPDAAQVPIQLIDNDLIKTLEHYLGNAQSSNLPTWIAACAVYPELHWDMTLYLGELLSDTNTQLLTSDNIAQICRMPWFTEGEIPLEARKTLLAWLEREQPDTLHTIREGIHRLLAQNPPPEDSAAHDAYAMNMALNEWLYTKDSARKKELENDILRRIAAGQAADFMVLKVLEGPRSPEEFEVPENWRKHLKQKGLAKTTRKSWVWAVPLWVLLCVGVVGWKPEEVGCKGVALTTQGKEWCAETLEEVMEVWEMQALNGMGQQDSTTLLNLADMAVRDILKAGRANAWKNQSAKNWQQGVGKLGLLGPIDSMSFFQNLAVGYFNKGVEQRYSANLSEILNKTIPGFGRRAKEAENAGCIYFLRAQELNVLLPDTAQLWYVHEAAKFCNTPFVERKRNLTPVNTDSAKLKAMHPTPSNADMALLEAMYSSVYFLRIESIKLTMDDKTEEILNVNITGTGFLLSDGRFITTRHMVQPWTYLNRNNPDAAMTLLNMVQNNSGVVNATLKAYSPDGSSFTFSSLDFKLDASGDETITVVEPRSNTNVFVKIGVLDDGKDWATIKTSRPGQISLGASVSEALPAGARLYTLGYPYGQGANDTTDIRPLFMYSNVETSGLTNGMIRITDRNFDPGCSGGPAFYSDGNRLVAVGIISTSLGNQGGLVPVSHIR